MLNGKISGRQAANMMVLFILGSSLVTGGGMAAKQDSWICVILGMLMTVPLVLIYAELNHSAPGKDIFEMSYEALGKFGGAVITILFTLYTIHLGALVVRNFTEYFQVVSIPETPQYVTAICIGLIAWYSVSKGMDVVARGSVFTMPLVMSVIILLNLFTLKYMNFSNLEPVLYHNSGKVFEGAYSLFTFPFAETVMFVTVFSIVETKKHPAKIYLLSLLFAGLVLTALVAVAIAIIGLPLVTMLYFPSYASASVMDIGNFISRAEVLVSGNYIIFGIVKVTVCLYVSCKGLAKLFNVKDHRVFSMPIMAVMIIESVLVYESTMQMFAFIDIYSIYAPFFEAAIPILLLIVIKVKKKQSQAKSAGAQA